MKLVRFLSLAAGALALFAGAAVAPAQGSYMNYQGRLNQPSGDAVTSGVYNLEISIYKDPYSLAVANRVWGPFQFDGSPSTTNGKGPRAVVTNGGRFNVILGPKDTNGVELVQAFRQNLDYYVDVRFNGGSPILPRQLFTYTPLAFRIPHVYPDVNGTPGIDIDTGVNIAGPLKVTGTVTAQNVTVSGTLTVNSSNIATIPIINQAHGFSQGTFPIQDANGFIVNDGHNFCFLAGVSVQVSTTGGDSYCQVFPVVNQVDNVSIWVIGKTRAADNCYASCIRIK